MKWLRFLHEGEAGFGTLEEWRKMQFEQAMARKSGQNALASR